MDDVDLTKCMDLSSKLGLVLGANPVWKDDCVIYGGNLGDAYIILMRLGNGCWEAITKIGGVLNLPQEAPELMAEMSKLAKRKED